MSQVPAFEPLRIYDAPSVALAQVFEGTATPSSLRDAFLAPQNLSPAQRKTLVDVMAGGDAGDGVMAGVAEILTNPFVWLMFVAGPAGSMAGRGTRSIFDVSKRASAYFRESPHWASVVGLSTTLDNFDGSFVGQMFQGVSSKMRRLKDLDTAELVEPEKRLLERMQAAHPEARFSSLNPSDYAKGTLERDVVEQVHLAMTVDAMRLGEEARQVIPTMRVGAVEVSVGGRGWQTSLPEGTIQTPGSSYDHLKTLQRQERRAREVHKEAMAKIKRDNIANGRKPNEGLVEYEKWEDSFRVRGSDISVDFEEVKTRNAVLSPEQVAAAEEIGARYGVEEVAETMQRVRNRRLVELIGDEERYASTGIVQLDQRKVDRLHAAIHDQEITGHSWGDNLEVQGKQLLGELLGHPNVEQLDVTALSRAQLGQLIGRGLLGNIRGKDGKFVRRWMPTASTTPIKHVVRPDGSIVRGSGEARYRLARGEAQLGQISTADMNDVDKLPHSFQASGRAVTRSSKEELFAIEDLETAQRHLGSSPELTNAFDNAYTQASKAGRGGDRGPGQLVFGTRMNSFEQTNRFLDNVQVDQTLYGTVDRDLIMLEDAYRDRLHDPAVVARLESKTRPRQRGGVRSPYVLRVGSINDPIITIRDHERAANTITQRIQKIKKSGAADDFTTQLELDNLRDDLKKVTGGRKVRYMDGAWDFSEAFNMHEMMQLHHAALGNQWLQREMRTTGMLAAFGKATPQAISQMTSHNAVKMSMAGFADSRLGRFIEGRGEGAKRFINQMRQLADPDVDLLGAGGISGKVAKYLYVTHLGINVASVMLNMTQPLLLVAPQYGLRNTLAAYGDAMQDMFTYAKKRTSQYGVRPISAAQRRKLIQESFDLSDVNGANLVGVGPDVFEELDELAFKKQGLAGAAGRQANNVLDYMMKGFEKSEWTNRLVAAHTARRFHGIARKDIPNMNVRQAFDIERTVLQTQFGQHQLNTPTLFLKSSVLNNPALRMFLTFPLRTATNVFVSFPRFGGKNWAEGFTRFAARGMAISALTYEVGKQTLGIDLSRGLFAASTADAFGGERLLQDGNEFIPIPPIIDIPMDMVRGLAGGDTRLISDSVARLVPGGVAINRAIGVSPPVPRSPLAGLPGSLQKTYVGWNEITPDGMVPLYDNDGSLIDYEPASSLVLRGMGVDLKGFNDQREVDAFLSSNRQKMVEMKRRWMQAMLQGNSPRMRRIEQQFFKTFQIPLRVEEKDVRRALKNRSASRSERLLETIPEEVRPTFIKAVAGQGRRFAGNLPEGGLLSGTTINQRMQQRIVRPEMTEAHLHAIAENERRAAARENVGPAATSRGFEGFGGF